MRIAALTSLCVVALAACPVADGGACILDSDCEPGLVCGMEGACTTMQKVDEAFHAQPDVVVVSLDAVGDAGASDAAPVDCVSPTGTWPCDPSAVDSRTVALFEIHGEGHGAMGLAGPSQLILPGGFEDGTLHMEFWVDGTLADGCGFRLGFVRDADDLDADCQPVYTDADKMPFAIPGVVELFIYNPTFTPSTGRFEGLVDKEEILAALDPALRSAFEPMVQENVDTDGDGTPDLATFIMTVTFE